MLKPSLTRFERRLVAALGEDRLTPRELVIAAAAVPAFRRADARARHRRRRQLYIGQPGDSVELAVHVVAAVDRTPRRDEQPIPLCVYVMRDADGRRLVWFSSAAVLEPGRSHLVRCVVRRHAVYRGEPESVLECCRILHPRASPPPR